jgi:hypothetical protein
MAGGERRSMTQSLSFFDGEEAEFLFPCRAFSCQFLRIIGIQPGKVAPICGELGVSELRVVMTRPDTRSG